MASNDKLVNIRMVRRDLHNIPNFPLPVGYELKWYKPGYEKFWFDIHEAAEQYVPVTPGLFAQQFGQDLSQLTNRQCYLLNADKRAIATATAWFDDSFRGRRFGRVHWVAVTPDYQGQGFAKCLTSVVCRRLKDLGHDCAYLTSQAQRIAAVNLYLKFGFVPDIATAEDQKVWQQLQDRVKVPFSLSFTNGSQTCSE